MNEIIRSLHERKSVRVFEDKKVSNEIKQELIKATLQAPTAGNQMMYSIIEITDTQLKNKLAITCDDQKFIATAPLVFVFVADQTRWIQSFKKAGATPRKMGKGDIMLAITDTAIAAQNMVVAAESLELGSCYIGDILENCEEHKNLLNLPPQTIPVCMLVLGYPTKQQKDRKKPSRFNPKYIVGENTYPHLSQEQLEECYYDFKSEDAVIKPFDEFMQAFCNRKYNSEFSIEMTRSVNEYLKEFD